MDTSFIQTFFNKNPMPMWIYDLETFQFLEVNESATIVYGYSRQEFLSMTIKDIRPPEDLPELMKVVGVNNNGYNDVGIWRHLKKNGDLLYVNISSQVIEYNGRKCELILSVDQTERVKIFEHSKLNESKLTSILNSMQDVIWSSDPYTFEILFVNQNVFGIYGYASEEFYQNPNLWMECIHPEDRQRVIDAFSNLHQAGKFEEEYRIIAKDNKLKWVNDKSWLVKDNQSDKVIRIDGILRDITKEKNNQIKIDELSQNILKQNEALKELAFMNSHKLRGPLVTILAGLELLQQDSDLDSIIYKLKSAGNELDHVIKSSMTYLSEVVNDTKQIDTSTDHEIEKVFCIDDDNLQLLVNERIIHRLNPNISIVNFDDAKLALNALSSERPDLIFLDLNMPSMSGWEFLDEMMNRNFNSNVFILSSSVDPYDKQKSIEYKNVKGFLSKPLSVDAIKSILTQKLNSI